MKTTFNKYFEELNKLRILYLKSKAKKELNIKPNGKKGII